MFWKQQRLMFFDAFSFAFPAALQRIPYSLFVSLIWTVVTYFPVGLSAEPSRCALVPSYATLCCAVLCTLCCAVLSFALCCLLHAVLLLCCAALCCLLHAVLLCAVLRCAALQCAMLLNVKIASDLTASRCKSQRSKTLLSRSHVTSSGEKHSSGVLGSCKDNAL